MICNLGDPMSLRHPVLISYYILYRSEMPAITITYKGVIYSCIYTCTRTMFLHFSFTTCSPYMYSDVRCHVIICDMTHLYVP